ncbi:sulfatase-like hydrolase/transferase [Kiritimatiella glycovorans]|uniref:Beta-galactosidase n=1 Tax=Kiritimatiella glycovorans TaxID=1307763 RepID=A0A0G3EG97_9BACT|nr:sulfatase-like hydrolase/transferase [Kiritimatiella glycovorans]AKJ65363.1 Beta-galactosidase [Kiritimatiella glycovorans]
MNRRMIATLAGAWLALQCHAAPRPERPNMVLFVVDDLGWRDTGAYGSRYYETPTIDRLAEEGVRFTRAYAAAAMCSPTRAALMTGRNPARLHLTNWIPGWNAGRALPLREPDWTPFLKLDETTLAEVFHAHGYATGHIGKWHLGDGAARTADHHGFEVNVGGYWEPGGGGRPYTYFSPYRNPMLPDGPAGEYLTDRLTDEALAFMDAHAQEPFFLHLSHFAVHAPLQGKPELERKYYAKPRLDQRAGDRTARYAAMIESVDESLARVLAKLGELGLAEKTVVVFTSDNGGLHLATSNAPLRAGKATAYEGGLRIPLIFRAPGTVRPGTVCDEPVITHDLYPTLLGLAGLEDAKGHEIDGLDLTPLLRGTGGLARESLHWHFPHYHPYSPPYSVILRGRWKLIEYLEDNALELYDLENDPGEEHNLARSHAEKAEALHRRLAAWREEVGAQMPTPDPAFDPEQGESVPVMGCTPVPKPSPDVSGSAPRRERLLNRGWTFTYGEGPETDVLSRYVKARRFKGTSADVGYDDSDWRALDLPHDFVVEGRIGAEHNFVRGGLPYGVGYYRRTWVLPAEAEGRRIALRFDGVYRNAQIFVNGFRVHEEFSGYTPFEVDISDFVFFGGTNAVLVRADASVNEGWWYEGGGIYRDVHLIETDPVHIPMGGIFVHATPEEDDTWALDLRTEVASRRHEDAEVAVRWRILDPAGAEAGIVEGAVVVPAGGDAEKVAKTELHAPVLWDLRDPRRYTLITSIHDAKGRVLDKVRTRFGVRDIRFDAERGCFLNGRPVKLKGACLHQDHAGIGIAVDRAVWRYRLERLQSMGCNAVRIHHYPPPDVAELADEMGMFLYAENRILSSASQYRHDLAVLVRTLRNHPSVLLWCVGNEENRPFGTDLFPQRILKELMFEIDRHDPYRPVIVARNNGGFDWPSFRLVDIAGFNYFFDQMAAYERDGQPVLSAESGSAVATRGVYADDRERGLLASYDRKGVAWGDSSQRVIEFAMSHPFAGGTFIWTGLDYRGEPTPFGWPNVSSSFGVMDLCGFPKDAFYLYKAWWDDEPVLHLLPHWTWPGREGEPIRVCAYSNSEEVELFVNGESCGRRAVPRYGYPEWEVAYAPGVLEAVGYRDGEEVRRERVSTAGEATKINARASKLNLAGDGRDAVVVELRIFDEAGTVVPRADHELFFETSGPIELIGVGNGDPTRHASDQIPRCRAFHGCAQVILRSRVHDGGEDAEAVLTVAAEGLATRRVRFRVHPGDLSARVPAHVTDTRNLFFRAREAPGSAPATGPQTIEEMMKETAGIEQIEPE